MKFLFLITHYSPQVYGAENFCQHLAEYLVEQGHQVDLVTGRWDNHWPKNELINGVSVYRVPIIKIRYLQTMFFILPQLFKACQLNKKNHYDYLHAHIFPSLITAALLNSKATKVVTLQGGDLADYPEIYGPLAPIFKLIIKICLKAYSRIHVVSQDLQAQVQALGLSSQVIPNGVELTVPKKISLPLTTQYKLYSPSRLTDKNNLENLILAVSQLRQQGIDLGLIIAGTGHLKNKLQAQIKALKLTSVIKLIGYLKPKTNLQYIKASHAVVRISLREGFGIALLEALALKTPVITSLSGGLKDFITPSNAFIAQSDSNSIAKVIKTCLLNPILAKQKADLGFKLVKEKYIFSKVLPQFIGKIYGL